MYTDNNDNNNYDNYYYNNDNNNNNTFNEVGNDTNSENNSDIDNNFYKYENQQYEMDNKPKKSKKVILWIIIALIILLALLGTLAFFYFKDRENNNNIGGNGTQQPPAIPNLVLNVTELNLKVGNTQKIEYTIENDNGNITINWSSSDTKIATIDKNGTVKGVKEGIVKITASYTVDGQEYEKVCSVTVSKASSTQKNPSVKLKTTSLNLKVGDSSKIEYTIENNNGKVTIAWKSNNTSIATVDQSGNVKGMKAGTTQIVVTYTINGKTEQKTCSVTVTDNSTTPVVDTTKPTLTCTVSKGKENTWVNTDVEIKTTASDNSGSVTVEYALNCPLGTCNYKAVTNNTITISSEGVTEVKIRAKDKAGNDTTRNVTVRIDKTKPTCSLDVAEDGTLTAENVSDKGGSELSYKGFSSTYSGTSETTKKLSAAGTYTYYVKDKAGNTDTCSLDVKTKTEYRYRDCTSCKSCIGAGCNTFTSWTNTGSQETVSESFKNYSTDYRRFNNCQLKESGKYLCDVQTRKCSSPKTSCSTCGCASFGEWSEWSEKKYTESATLNHLREVDDPRVTFYK